MSVRGGASDIEYGARSNTMYWYGSSRNLFIRYVLLVQLHYYVAIFVARILTCKKNVETWLNIVDHCVFP